MFIYTILLYAWAKSSAAKLIFIQHVRGERGRDREWEREIVRRREREREKEREIERR